VVPHFRSRLELTAETPIFRMGAADAARRARAGTAVADLTLEQSLADVRRDVKHAYFALLSAEAGLTVAHEALEQAQAHRRLVDDLVQAGRATRLDQLQGDVEVEQASIAAADAADARELAAASLLRTLGGSGVQASRRSGVQDEAGQNDQRPQVPAVPAERLNARTPERLTLVPPPPELGPSPDEARALAAVEQRADVRALAAQVQAAEAGVRLARAQTTPSINLVAGYALQTPSAFVASSSWNTGLNLVLPLGQRVQAREDGREATARAAAARAALEELRQGAALEIQQALSALRSARRRREASTRAVAAAEEALRISELRFQVGRATGLEVAAARAALNRARLDGVRALYDWYTGLADLERATGEPVPALGRER
jgi:outer membrane protein TolC